MSDPNRVKLVSIRLTEAEWQLACDAADADHRPLSGFILAACWDSERWRKAMAAAQEASVTLPGSKP